MKINPLIISKERHIYYAYRYASGYVFIGKIENLNNIVEGGFTAEYSNLDDKKIITILRYNKQIHTLSQYSIEECLPLGILLKELKKINLSRFIVNGSYERFPASFKDAVSYKCWLQSAFAEFGWGIWDDLIVPEDSSYGMDKAVYTACLNRNNGRAEDYKVPTANSIFEELKKLEVREGIVQIGA